MLRRLVPHLPAALLACASAGGALLVSTGAAIYRAGRITDPTQTPWAVLTTTDQVLIALVTIAALSLSYWAWERRGASGRLANGVIAITFGLLGGLGAAAGTTVLVFAISGLARPRSTQPESFVAAEIGLYALIAIVLFVALLLVYLWWSRIEHDRFPIFLLAPAVAVPVVVFAMNALADDPQPVNPRAVRDRARTERNIAPREDVMVLIDPGERAGRRLIRLARKRPRAFTERRAGVLPWDLLAGIAVPGTAGTRWKPILRPTTRRATLRRALAERIPIRRRRANASEWGQALRGLGRGRAASWRAHSVKSIAVLADQLPWVAAPGTARPTGALARALSSLRPPAVPSTSDQRRRVVALQVVTSRRSSSRLRQRWAGWAGATGGSLTLPGRFLGERHALDSAEDAVTARADAEKTRVATEYRPHLYFDRLEHYRPLDVDSYLSEPGDDGDAGHRLCRASALAKDDCVPVRGARDLRPGFDTLQSPEGLADDAQIEPDTDRRPPAPERLYYHASSAGDHLYLDYWWFLRFNASPVASGVMCIRGLAIREATCFDHEGDWEGVTVTLRRASAAGGRPRSDWVGESVSYAGHAWRYRYDWPALRGVRAIEDDTHAAVYSARGSHASYPVPCGPHARRARGTCNQLGREIPDGQRSGTRPWVHNSSCESCVLELPADQYDTPALWNAFGGRWGAATCTLGLKLCVRGDGPLSPSFQRGRYGHPEAAPPGRERDLYRRAKVRFPKDRSGR